MVWSEMFFCFFLLFLSAFFSWSLGTELEYFLFFGLVNLSLTGQRSLPFVHRIDLGLGRVYILRFTFGQRVF